MYDAIIAGASFAGLTLATQLKGNILIIEQKPIGKFRMSTCGVPVDIIKNLGAERSIIQSFDTAVVHTKNQTKKIKLIRAYCTFDYNIFCKKLFSDSDVSFLQASALGVKDNTVLTSKGDYSGKLIADCTGWRAVLASSINPDFVNKHNLFFGVEAEMNYQAEDMHFFFNPDIVDHGYAWVFPIGGKSRIGLGSSMKLDFKKKLSGFQSSLGLDPVGSSHGGVIPYGLRPPVWDKLFLVGDSAGQALPLTAEGIRQTIYFAKSASKSMQAVIDGQLSLTRGLNAYRRIVERKRRSYNFLLNKQIRLFQKPQRLEKYLRILAAPGLGKLAQAAYMRI